MAVSETDKLSIPAELEARLLAVEQAAAEDPGLTPRDWITLCASAVAIPAFVLWLGWTG